MKKIKNFVSLFVLFFIFCNCGIEAKASISGFVHKTQKRYFAGKPAIINIVTINPQINETVIKPSFGNGYLYDVRSVKEFARLENAVLGVNASYFKPDNGVPLGLSVIDNKILTGTLFDRVSFGVTSNNRFKMAKVSLEGKILIDAKELKLHNINQPILSKKDFSVFTAEWGAKTLETSEAYVHIAVENNTVKEIKRSCIEIPKNGFVIVGPHKYIPQELNSNSVISYETELSPKDWSNVKYAVAGGPYLVKDGKKFVDKQNFSNNFLSTKAPRTAIGYTKAGILIVVTVDGRQKDISYGVTIKELAQIMYDIGAYNAMNLDGGSSTQMVLNNKIINKPTVKGGARVTNALLVSFP
ncbi:MAG: phosphodiester glycosidase family protein [Candidatus Gastranaerophilales bacterium]|nr:phosphodiester glycosidase family protein [Candidatus Gastranaerophilales bacterium]